MNSSGRILIPVGLFIAFAFAHHMATQSDLVRFEIAVAKSNLTKGRRIQPEQLEPLSIYVSKSNKSLEKSFVIYDARGLDVLYRPLNRNIQSGEIVSLADLLPEAGNAPPLDGGEVGIQIPLQGLEFSASQLKVGSNIGFVVERMKEDANDLLKLSEPTLLQPFRLVGIGDVVTAVRDTGGKEEAKNSKILTIAVKVQEEDRVDQKTNLLLRAASGNESLRIINIVVLPEPGIAKGNR